MGKRAEQGATADAADGAGWSRGSRRLVALATLCKPGISGMVVATGLVGLGFGRSPEKWTVGLVLATGAGVGLSCMGACALNQVSERHTDARMRRTRSRPLPCGRLSPTAAMFAGVLLAASGVAVLAVWTTWLAGAIAGATALGYVLAYTPLKKHTPAALFVGALPGAAPPMIGVAAGSGRIGPAACVLFLILYVWQIPHFLAIAWRYQEDYARAGLPVYPVCDPTGTKTLRVIIGGALVLAGVCALPTLLGISGWPYLLVGLGASGVFVGLATDLGQRPTRLRARRLFRASLLHLPIVYAVMLIDAT